MLRTRIMGILLVGMAILSMLLGFTDWGREIAMKYLMPLTRLIGISNFF
ncbi:MAG: hypothetical protein HQ564_05630 [Candidatus Saganbacteria bacterium]|nr:hypothetical protein [Candidatus Saganbacteria bacterium]